MQANSGDVAALSPRASGILVATVRLSRADSDLNQNG
jgi:hypothetical protein